MSSNLITLAEGATDDPLAAMIFDLVAQNIADNQPKSAALTSLRLIATIVATDLESVVSLEFRGNDGLLVHSGYLARTTGNANTPAVTIRADCNGILDLARLSLLRGTGIPILWDEVGSSVARRFIRRQIQVRPLIRHLGKLTGLMQVISVI
jgi:hypothetical protein